MDVDPNYVSYMTRTAKTLAAENARLKSVMRFLAHLGKDGILCWCDMGRFSNQHSFLCETIRKEVLDETP